MANLGIDGLHWMLISRTIGPIWFGTCALVVKSTVLEAIVAKSLIWMGSELEGSHCSVERVRLSEKKPGCPLTVKSPAFPPSLRGWFDLLLGNAYWPRSLYAP